MSKDGFLWYPMLKQIIESPGFLEKLEANVPPKPKNMDDILKNINSWADYLAQNSAYNRGTDESVIFTELARLGMGYLGNYPGDGMIDVTAILLPSVYCGQNFEETIQNYYGQDKTGINHIYINVANALQNGIEEVVKTYPQGAVLLRNLYNNLNKAEQRIIDEFRNGRYYVWIMLNGNQENRMNLLSQNIAYEFGLTASQNFLKWYNNSTIPPPLIKEEPTQNVPKPPPQPQPFVKQTVKTENVPPPYPVTQPQNVPPQNVQNMPPPYPVTQPQNVPQNMPQNVPQNMPQPYFDPQPPTFLPTTYDTQTPNYNYQPTVMPETIIIINNYPGSSYWEAKNIKDDLIAGIEITITEDDENPTKKRNEEILKRFRTSADGLPLTTGLRFKQKPIAKSIDLTQQEKQIYKKLNDSDIATKDFDPKGNKEDKIVEEQILCALGEKGCPEGPEFPLGILTVKGKEPKIEPALDLRKISASTYTRSDIIKLADASGMSFTESELEYDNPKLVEILKSKAIMNSKK